MNKRDQLELNNSFFTDQPTHSTWITQAKKLTIKRMYERILTLS